MFNNDMLSGFELYPRWVPLYFIQTNQTWILCALCKKKVFPEMRNFSA